MRFDPQANVVDQEAELANPGAPMPAHLAARSPLKTAMMILATGFVVGGGLWFWSDGIPGQVKAYATAAPVEVEAREPSGATSALIQYAQAVLSHKSDDEKLAAVTGQAIGGGGDAHRRNHKKAVDEFEAGKRALAMARYPDAIGHFTEAIRMEPGYAPAHYRLGLAYVRIGRMDAATAEHTVLQKLDKDLANLLVNLIR